MSNQLNPQEISIKARIDELHKLSTDIEVCILDRFGGSSNEQQEAREAINRVIGLLEGRISGYELLREAEREHRSEIERLKAEFSNTQNKED